MPHIMRLPELFPWADIINDKAKFDITNDDFQENILSPYSIEGGEIAKFRLKLKLNDLGKAFLIAEPFICKGIFSTKTNISDLNNFAQDYKDSLKFRIFNNK